MTREAVIRVGPGSATLRHRWLGARLREKREATGLTLKDVGQRMDRSHPTVSQWETGVSVPRLPDLLFMLDLYRVRGDERDGFVRLQEEARERKDDSSAVSVTEADYAWLESRAYKVEQFSDVPVPGLFQTPEYVREIIKAWDPATNPERIERIVAARIARQKRLVGEDRLQVSAILDEAVLRHRVGGPAVMHAQLRHLIDQAALPNVEVRIAPYASGAHAGFTGAFTILRFRNDRALVHVITRGGDIYFEDAEPFQRALRRLAKTALSARRSAAVIAAATRETT